MKDSEVHWVQLEFFKSANTVYQDLKRKSDKLYKYFWSDHINICHANNEKSYTSYSYTTLWFTPEGKL